VRYLEAMCNSFNAENAKILSCTRHFIHTLVFKEPVWPASRLRRRNITKIKGMQECDPLGPTTWGIMICWQIREFQACCIAHSTYLTAKYSSDTTLSPMQIQITPKRYKSTAGASRSPSGSPNQGTPVDQNQQSALLCSSDHESPCG
jgi:hypothetical protein